MPGKSRTSRSLTATLASAFLVLSVVVLLIAGSIQMVFNFQMQQDIVAGKQQLIAQGAANAVAGFIQEKFSVLESAVKLGDLTSASEEEQKRTLQDLLGLDRAFRQLVLSDSQDQALVKVSRVSQAAAEQLANRIESRLFAQVKQGNRYISPVYIDELTSEPMVVVAVPATDIFGDLQGTLLAEVNLKFMWDLVDRLEIGEMGLAYVVDRQGNLLAFGDIARVLRGEDVAHLKEVNEFISSSAPADVTGASISSGINGTSIIGTYVPLGTPDWAVVTELPLSEAYQEVIQSVVISLAVIVAVAMLAGLAGAYVARRLAVPLLNLTETATQITEGKVDLQAVPEGPTEVASLATAFNSMTAQLRESIGTLEQRVAERTRDLEHRAIQLATAADVGRAASSILELGTLSRRVVELIRERFDLYYAALFLLDEEGRFAVLESGSGEAGSTMKLHGHRLEVGGMSMVGTACAQGQARIALDVGEEPIRFDNPLLPNTRSEMALPLMVGDRVLGALDVQSTRPAAFSKEDIAALQLVADQVAVAVDNARKFSEESSLLEATSPIFRASLRTTRAATTAEVIQATTASIAETEADGCAVALFDFGPRGKVENFTFLGRWDRRGNPTVPVGVPIPVRATGFPHQMVMTLWTIDDIAKHTQIPEKARQFLAKFNSQAMVNLPLKAGERVIGFVIVHRAAAGPFSQVVLRFYTTLAGLAAVALERTQLLEEAQDRATHEQLARQATESIRSAVSVEDAIQRAIREMSRVLGASEVVARIGTERELLSEPGGDGHE